MPDRLSLEGGSIQLLMAEEYGLTRIALVYFSDIG
jgi:hypothetical protein